MEKLKNLINPGHKKDDEVLYGSGQSDDPVHTGEGATGDSSTSRMPGGFDDTATTASVKSGIAGEAQTGSKISDPLNTNKPLPGEPAAAGSGYNTGASGAGPHTLSLANKADPRVDSDLDGSRGITGGSTGSGLTGTSLPDRSIGSSGVGHHSTSDSSHLGRDAALGAGALGAGEAAHHHREKQDIGTGSGREFPVGGSSTTSGSGYPSGTAGTNTNTGLGSTTGGYGSGTGPVAGSANQGSLSSEPHTGAYNEESWTHDHSKHGHQYAGDPCGPEESAPGAPHFTKGPHATDTANRLDPHVGSGISAPTDSTNTGGSAIGSGFGSTSSGTGTGSSSTGLGSGSSSTAGTGLGSSTSGTGDGSSTTGDRHLGRDTALAAGAGATGVGAYESSRGGSSTTTAGPHDSNLLNKADPRVDSDLSRQHGTSATGTSGLGQGTSTVGPASGVVGNSAQGTALPSDTVTSSSGSTTGRDHHLGRDAGIAGAGATGLGAYEAEKHRGGQGLTGTSSGSTSDPYSSAGVDPRVDSSSRSGTSGLTGTTGAGKDHHYGRDAGLAGAGGMAAYEGEKHLGGKHDPTATGTSSKSTGYGTPGQVLYDSGRGPTTSGAEQPSTATGSTSTAYGTPGKATSGYDQQSTGHHFGRDAGVAGATGAGAYEAEKHLGKKDHSRDAYGTGPTDTKTDTSTGHHYGRDAALGAGGIGGGAAAYEAEKRHGTQQPLGTSAAYDNQQAAPTQSHAGRDTALAGGAGAGAGAVAGSEFSKNQAERDAHQGLQDQKAREKELAAEHKAHDKALAKDEKHHQKELEKEQKHHQKEVAAAEKKHEKEVEKAEKKHDKELSAAEKKHEQQAEKEEKHEEKKHHGGILGLFKREKPDDELKRENLERKGELGPEGYETAAGAGAGTAGLSDFEQHERSGEHAGMSEADKLRMAKEHDRNRLHKDPPPGYVEKKMEEQGHHPHGGSTGSGYQTLPDGRVVEPHTGLPVDMSKGSGAGGTDDTPVPGIHSHHQ